MSKFGNKLVAMLPGKGLLHNRVVLYALCIIALVQIVMYGNSRDFNSVITFTIIGFLVSFFSKNMIIVLGAAILITYVLNCIPSRKISEGAQNMKEGVDEMDSAEKATDTSVADIANSAASAAETATAPTEAEKKKSLYDNLQSDFKDFEQLQASILKSMQDIDPLLAKAESFIEKFEHYNKIATTGEAA